MRKVQHFFISMIESRSHLMMGVVVLSLIGAAGCDPCLNNPCDDGVACNGTETCTASGGQVECSAGTTVECTNGQTCTEPDGICDGCVDAADCDDGDLCTTDTCDSDGSCTNDPIMCPAGETCDEATGDCLAGNCTSDADCDDGDLCTTDTCTADEICDNADVMCAAGETCDPNTGNCMASGTATPQTLIGAAGNFTGATTCGDDDGVVSLFDNNGMLTLNGLTGNGDIPVTQMGDLMGTASGVTAFGMGDHTMTLTLDPATGDVSLHLENGNGGSCDSTLVSMP